MHPKTKLDGENEQEQHDGLTDYKIFCFNGEPKFLYISRGLENHETAQISFYDLEGNELDFHRSDYRQLGNDFTLPMGYSEMLKAAKKLSNWVNNPFIRVDMYSISSKFYFSEITFSPCDGFIPFTPSKWDEKIGSMLKLGKC